MLESLRKWATGWVAFILIGLLILSFAIWGVADVFTGYQRGALATVGDETITEQEFQRALNNELNAISQQAGRRITLEQARTFGLDQQVMSRLVGAAAVGAHAKEMGLALSDEAIAEGLRRDPNFQDADGNFSRPLLQAIMRQIGVNEQGLIAMRREDELREHVTTAILRTAVVPDPMIDIVYAHRNAKRVVSHFTIDADKVLEIGDPSEDDLKTTYETNKRRFMTPQRRDFSALVLTPEALKAKAPITDEEIKTAYAQTKSTYDKPEKREIEQIAFQDKAAAEKARSEIEGGKDFMAVAEANGATEVDVKLGLKTKDELIDPKIADAAFSLEGGKVSDPIEGQFTTVLLRVTKIVDGEESTLDEVKDQIRDQLAGEWAAEHLRQLYDQVDEGRASARPLDEIGKDLGIRHFEIKAADSGNKLEDKSIALDVPGASTIMATVFGAEVGIEPEPVELPRGGFAWVDVTKVTKPEQKPFDAVKDEVRALWTAKKRRDGLRKAAQDFVKRASEGEDFAKIAADAGGSVKTTEPFTRGQVPDGLTQAAVSQAFVLKSGQAATVETADGKSRLVVRVDEIVPAGDPDKDAKTALRNELSQQLRTDQIAVYLAKLQERYGVDINQAALARLTGANVPR